MQQVIDETLRLYPPVPFIVRDVKRDVQIGGISVRRGTTAFIPVYAVHRHRKLWDDPDRFDPGRFSKERRSKISRYQFIPYGAGPRICIGAAFAAIELVMLLATFVRAARFEILPNFHPVPVGRSVLVPKRGMPMNVILRDEI